MSGPLDVYFKSIQLAPKGLPDFKLEIEWNKSLKRLEFKMTFKIDPLLQEYESKGIISITDPSADGNEASVTMTYPVVDEVALRTLTQELSPALVSMAMGIANDLAPA